MAISFLMDEISVANFCLRGGLSAARVSVFVLGFHKCFQVVQACGPEDAVLLDPRVDGAERFGIELVDAVAPFAMLADQMSAAQADADASRWPGRETGNALAICPAGWLPRRSRSRTARRVGSARAWKVISLFRSAEYVTDR